MTLPKHANSKRIGLGVPPTRTVALVLFLALMMLGVGAGVAAAQEDTANPQQNALVESLSNLDAPKLNALYDHIGIEPSPEYFNCMCPGGFHYWGGPEGACRRIGVLGGIAFTGYQTENMRTCAATYPLADGRTVLDAVAAAAAGATKPQEESCSALPAGTQTLTDMRQASPFAYGSWPPLFDDVAPERILYEFSENEREALKAMGDRIAEIGNGIVDRTLEVGQQASDSAAQLARKAKDVGYDILVNNEKDLRLDVKLAEFAFRYNPESKRMELSEFLLKYDPYGGGANIEIAAGVDKGTWDGKLKFGFSLEKKFSGLQIEGKFGLEFDSNVVPVLSLDDEPPPASRSYLEALKANVEKLIEGLSPYAGVAAGPSTQIGPGEIAFGPEVTKVFRDDSWINGIYSDMVFGDMYEALDNMLVQQKRVEEARHAHVRAMATRLGVENADCMSIGDVTIAIQGKIIDEARRQGVPTEGRTIKDIRKDLTALGATGQ
ncbi:MAG: hypothetical protein Q8L54_15285 [Devosia sp.]|nr:hypothetical protein [Devosia sp.]